MLKKRILALICIFACIMTNVSAAPIFSDIPENSNEEKVLNVVKGLGLMNGYEDGSFQPREAVKRGEVAQIVCNIMGFEYDVTDEKISWENEYLGDDSKDTELIVAETGESSWTDVPTNSWAYKAIRQATGVGVMQGDGESSFRPEDTVTYNEMIKVILSLGGYSEEAKYYGGYPDGYAKIAAENGLLTGVSGTGESRMSRMDVARILYNSLKLHVRKYTYKKSGLAIDSDNEQTFMNEIMNIYSVTQTLTRTDITSVDSPEVCGKGKASLNGFEFKFSDEQAEIRDYIGRNIRIYVHEEDNEYRLLCWEETGKDDITEIGADVFDGYADNTFTYFKEKDSSSKKRVTVGSNFNLIYNGKYKGSYGNGIFNIKNGSITVIKSGGEKSDIVVVEDYTSGYTSVVNTKEKYVVDKLAEGTGSAIINFEKDGETATYCIWDSDGGRIELDDISNGAINYFVNDGYIKMYYSKNSVAGEISEIYDEGDEKYISIDDVSYKVENVFLSSKNSVPLSTGMKISGYIDIWGNIVWLTNDAVSSSVGYLVKAAMKGNGSGAELKFFDFVSGSMTTADAADKLTYFNKYNESSKPGADKLVTLIGEYVGVFSYEKDAAGKIKKIRMPLDKNLSSNELNIRSMYTASTLSYNMSLGTMGNAYITSGVKILQLPADEAQYDDYKLIAQGTLRNRSYTCDIFNFDAKSRIAKFMVLKNSSDATGYIAEEASLWVVTDIVKSYDADKNEESTQVTVTDGANIQTLTADTDICTLDGVKNPFGKTDSSGNEYTLSPGDLVRFELMNGKVVNIQIMYDADGKNPAWYGADPAAKTTDVPPGNENYTNVLGSIPGCTGFHHGPDNYSTYTNTNPFGYAYDIISGSKRVFGNTVFRSCYVYGFAYAEYENYMTISTQNLHGSFDGEIEKDNWYTETFNPAGADIVVVKGNGKRVSVKKGKISDIKTYEQAGTDCSKILVCHGYNYSTGRIFVFDN